MPVGGAGCNLTELFGGSALCHSSPREMRQTISRDELPQTGIISRAD